MLRSASTLSSALISSRRSGEGVQLEGRTGLVSCSDPPYLDLDLFFFEGGVESSLELLYVDDDDNELE